MTAFFKKYWPVFAFIPCQLLLGFGYLRWVGKYEYGDMAGVFSDDFYYYVKVAQSILDKGMSTFDGFTLTNGYHPLWLWCIVGMGKMCGGFGSGFFVLLRIVVVVLNFLFGLLLWRLCLVFFANRWVRYAVFFFHYFLVSRLGFMGMELTPLMPMLLLFVAALLAPPPWPARKWIGLGALAGVMVLTRIDSLVFVMGAFAILFWRAANPQQRRLAVLAGGLCLAPFALYLLYNYTHFGALMPVSALAKQLKKSLAPSTNFLHALLVPGTKGELFSRSVPLVCALVGALASLLAGSWRSRGTPSDSAEPAVARLFSLEILWVMAFPFAYYSMLMIRYDWTMDEWYVYPLPQASLLGLAVVNALLASRPCYSKVLTPIGAAGLVMSAVFCVVSLARQWAITLPRQVTYNFSLDLRDFARTHPGIIGLGDRAGFAAFINPSPILQLEGLMSDLRMVEHIKREDDLVAVLQEYGAKYYAVCVELPRGPQGYEALEPQRPGNLACKMKGFFKDEPLVRTNYPNGSVLWIFQVPPRTDHNT